MKRLKFMSNGDPQSKGYKTILFWKRNRTRVGEDEETVGARESWHIARKKKTNLSLLLPNNGWLCFRLRCLNPARNL